MWIKTNSRQIGRDDTIELTVENDVAPGFSFSAPINLTVAEDRQGYIAKAKAAFAAFMVVRGKRSTDDTAVDNIIGNLNN